METSSKNIGPFLAFNTDWFERHQGILLWLLNSSITKRWFRWVLRIRKSDIGYDALIVKILPKCYTVFNRWVDAKTVELTSDFRTHPKFGKRMYYAFRPLWWAVHFWDWAVADRFVPQWSYGFSTLTAQPAAGANSPVDGSVHNQNNTWSTCQSAGTGNVAHTSDVDSPALTLGGTPNEIERIFTLFDTSALTSSASISSATYSLWQSANGTSGTGVDTTSYRMVTTTPASNSTLATSDFGNVGTTAQSDTAISNAEVASGAYTVWTLNATGLGNINKTSITKFGLRELTHDVNNSTPTNGHAYYAYFYMADQTGTSNDPKLGVTYTTDTALANMWLPANNQPIFEQIGIVGY